MTSLQDKLGELTQAHNMIRNGVPMKATVASLLLDQCERRAKFELDPGRQALAERFDPLFRELHNFVVSRITDHLRSRLQEEGLHGMVAGEVTVPLGRYDVLLTSGNPCRMLNKDREVLRIEVKTAQSLPLDQITRYLWSSPSPLVVARLLTGQVAVLRPDSLFEFLSFAQKEVELKASRLLCGEDWPTPGPDCLGCENSACEWNQRRLPSRRGIISMRDFEGDLQSVMRNLPVVARKIGNIAIQELQTDSRDKPVEG